MDLFETDINDPAVVIPTFNPATTDDNYDLLAEERASGGIPAGAKLMGITTLTLDFATTAGDLADVITVTVILLTNGSATPTTAVT